MKLTQGAEDFFGLALKGFQEANVRSIGVDATGRLSQEGLGFLTSGSLRGHYGFAGFGTIGRATTSLGQERKSHATKCTDNCLMRPPQSLLGMEVRPISDSQRGWKAKHQKTWLLTCLPPVKKSAYQLELRFRITLGCGTSGFHCSPLSSILWSLSTFGHGCNLLSYVRGCRIKLSGS